MPDMGIFEAMTNPDEILRALFGRGNCQKFGGQWDTLTSWGWNEAYQKAYKEFIYPKLYEDETYWYSSNTFMKRIPHKDFEKIKAEKSKEIYENILPKWWQMFLDCLTQNMIYINKTNRWQVIDNHKTDKKIMSSGKSGKKIALGYETEWTPYEVIEASNGEELLTQIFMRESGFGYFPNDPKDNDYFVYTARRYFGDWTHGGFVIQRYYNDSIKHLRGNNSNLRLVYPTL